MPGITTSSSPAAATVGVQISSAGDAATVTGNGDVVPTGSVTFTLYAADCATVILGPSPSEPLSSNGSTPASASASYATSWTPTATGTYYWVATYSGDSNYETMTDGCGDPSEQLTVNGATPGMSTMASPTTVTVGVASTVKDTATLTGGDAPSGTVTFGLYTNSGCTTAVTPAVGGTVAERWNGELQRLLDADDGGTYDWQATYNGDSNNNSVSTCGGTSEQVKVSATTPTLGTVASPTTATVGVAITAKDTATLTGGDAPSGTVTFGLYTNSGCTTAVTPAVGGDGAAERWNGELQRPWTPTTVGTYYWQATYNGDSNNNSVSTCGGTSEQVKVSATTPTLGTVASPTTATVGVAITAKDTATLTGGDAPSGTVTFGLYTNSGCTTAVTPAVGGTVPLSGGTASSAAPGRRRRWGPTTGRRPTTATATTTQ